MILFLNNWKIAAFWRRHIDPEWPLKPTEDKRFTFFLQRKTGFKNSGQYLD